MRRFQIKSVVLGIGIGIILTSIMSIVYVLGSNPGDGMSKEQVLEVAKRYGMVNDMGQIVKADQGTPATAQPQPTPTPVQQSPTPLPATPTPLVTPTPMVTPIAQNPGSQALFTNISDKQVMIVVKRGDSTKTVAQKLLAAGLISDKDAFVREMANAGLTRKIVAGQYIIDRGSDTKTIMNVLIRAK